MVVGCASRRSESGVENTFVLFVLIYFGLSCDSDHHLVNWRIREWQYGKFSQYRILSDCRWMTVRHAVGKHPEFPTFLKTLNWRDGTGDNSSENWTLHEFFSPIFSLSPRRIQRCTVTREQTKTRVSPSLIWPKIRSSLRRRGCYITWWSACIPEGIKSLCELHCRTDLLGTVYFELTTQSLCVVSKFWAY